METTSKIAVATEILELFVFASDDPFRPALQFVRVEPDRAFATDSYRATIVHLKTPCALPFAIPADTAKALVKLARKAPPGSVFFDPVASTIEVVGGPTFPIPHDPPQSPDIGQVLALFGEPGTATLGINAEHLADLQAFLKRAFLPRCQGVFTTFHKDPGAFRYSSELCTAVIMGIRS